MYFKLLSYFLLRMSLAMYAAPFDNDINQINTNSSNNDNLQGRKKVVNNKTIKKYPKDNEKVNSVLQSIQNLPSSSSSSSYSSQDDGNFLGDFTPLPPPSSAGVENTRIKEQTLQNKQQQPQPQQEQQDHLNYGSKINSGTDLDDGYPTHPMYQQHFAQPAQSTHSLQPAHQQSHMMPNYAAMYSMNNQSQSNSVDSNDLLLQKLNYMINLLEQSQDERTNNVTEEIVLYSFLGIFIIFIVDSFVRVGKYVR